MSFKQRSGSETFSSRLRIRIRIRIRIWIRNQSGQWIRIRIGIQPKMLDPDPDEMNADPQPWFSYGSGFADLYVRYYWTGIRILHSSITIKMSKQKISFSFIFLAFYNTYRSYHSFTKVFKDKHSNEEVANWRNQGLQEVGGTGHVVRVQTCYEPGAESGDQGPDAVQEVGGTGRNDRVQTCNEPRAESGDQGPDTVQEVGGIGRKIRSSDV